VGALRLGIGRTALSADYTHRVHEAMARMAIRIGTDRLSDHALSRIFIQCHHM